MLCLDILGMLLRKLLLYTLNPKHVARVWEPSSAEALQAPAIVS
jgi:hypothetical protein